MAKSKPNLRWYNDELCWKDQDLNIVKHPRYSDKPESLESKRFLNSYMKAVAQGRSLNYWMKTNQKFSATEVQKAARAWRTIYRKATKEAGIRGDFPLLVKKSLAGPADTKYRQIINALLEHGVKTGHEPELAQFKANEPAEEK